MTTNSRRERFGPAEELDSGGLHLDLSAWNIRDAKSDNRSRRKVLVVLVVARENLDRVTVLQTKDREAGRLDRRYQTEFLTRPQSDHHVQGGGGRLAHTFLLRVCARARDRKWRASGGGAAPQTRPHHDHRSRGREYPRASPSRACARARDRRWWAFGQGPPTRPHHPTIARGGGTFVHQDTRNPPSKKQVSRLSVEGCRCDL